MAVGAASTTKEIQLVTRIAKSAESADTGQLLYGSDTCINQANHAGFVHIVTVPYRGKATVARIQVNSHRTPPFCQCSISAH